ncbi:hypothetical protein M408DRAFT_20740 [Serendipita vermifera MAFF 305830]|uniref:Mitochondrial carrier n=1 Tax=Serendipita vermifera MAFF 305830 TaxID=933852 RepID=A0A0C3BLV5_SERVB|nr:hypothetical protein M408DRAFT_20740 [Serendipita vermifera MAFF 305830]
MSSPSPLSTLESFFCGGLAACVAVTISNPAEVAKTRLQLQGELTKGGGKRVYTSAVDVLRKTWKNEGLRGIQRGLPPGYVYQTLLNGSRLGFYEPIRRTLNKVFGFTPTDQIAYTSVMAGAASGVVGACLGNPMFLIKARMQAYSPALPVGAQHNYKSSFDALKSIYTKDGPRGLIRGMDAAVLRTAAGSSVQLPSYNWTKNQIVQRGLLPADSTWTFLASSTVSGACVCLVMQPFDTALTRVYNQPTERRPDGRGGFRTVGLLYRNPIDCLWKTISTEGVTGLYKGSTAHFLRIAPHTIVTLTANELIINLYRTFRDKKPE